MLSLFNRSRKGSKAKSKSRISDRSFLPQLEALGGNGANSLRALPARRVTPELEALEDRQVPAVVASATLYDTSYELFSNGALYQHSGTNSGYGWTYVTSGVSKVSVGRDYYGQDAQFVLFNNGALYLSLIHI